MVGESPGGDREAFLLTAMCRCLGVKPWTTGGVSCWLRGRSSGEVLNGHSKSGQGCSHIAGRGPNIQTDDIQSRECSSVSILQPRKPQPKSQQCLQCKQRRKHKTSLGEIPPGKLKSKPPGLISWEQRGCLYLSPS